MSEYLLPTARKRNLVVQELPEEILVYDQNKNKAICLNLTAKLVWEQCNGRTTLEKAAENIGRKLKSKINDEILWVALEQLKKYDLFDESQPIIQIPKVSRRDLMKSGVSLSVALPFITFLAAPSAINAQSVKVCTQAGGTCSVVPGVGDNCCTLTSCTKQTNGICCIIFDVSCDPFNNLCCPGTVCNSTTNKCAIPT